MGFLKTANSVFCKLTISAILFSALLPLQEVKAQSCHDLKSELRRLEAQASARSPASRKWTSAYKKQQVSLDAAERDARLLGCNGSSSTRCSALNSKIKRMKSNLRAIERQQAKTSGSSQTSKRIRQVRASIKNKGCGTEQAQRDKPRSLFQRLFGSRAQEEVYIPSSENYSADLDRNYSQRRASVRAKSTSNQVRAVCVRTCDGYIFPVSRLVSETDLVGDEIRCSELCPASRTELYVYNSIDPENSELVSLTGELYAEQTFANRYKTEFVQNCGCRQTRSSKQKSAWTELKSGSGNRVYFADIAPGLPATSLLSRDKNVAAVPSPSVMTRSPLRRSQLPQYEDPDTQFNFLLGYDVTVDLDVVQEQPQLNESLATASTNPYFAQTELPLLSLRNRTTFGDEAETETAPVFIKQDDGFRPAPQQETGVRVVGPEYFVSQ